jgi:hypothetical protein
VRAGSAAGLAAGEWQGARTAQSRLPVWLGHRQAAHLRDTRQLRAVHSEAGRRMPRLQAVQEHDILPRVACTARLALLLCAAAGCRRRRCCHDPHRQEGQLGVARQQALLQHLHTRPSGRRVGSGVPLQHLRALHSSRAPGTADEELLAAPGTSVEAAHCAPCLCGDHPRPPFAPRRPRSSPPPR